MEEGKRITNTAGRIKQRDTQVPCSERREDRFALAAGMPNWLGKDGFGTIGGTVEVHISVKYSLI